MTDKRCDKSMGTGLRAPLMAAAMAVALGLATTRPATAQQNAGAGINWQGFTLHSSVDVGGRFANPSGNIDNYNTIVNLHQGVRLFNFNLLMNSPKDTGKLFNTLSLTGFGFGGDPDTVAHLAVSKGKVYAFDARFRRNVYYFGYNLQANPLNPSTSNPTVPITTPLHQVDYLRTMGDYNLTLMPESAFSVRLGYSHIGEGGPSFTTVGAAMAPGVGEVGIDTALVQNYKTTTDMYRAGFDYTPFTRTRVSFTELIQHTKGDTSLEDQHYFYQLAAGTPVDLGVVFNTPGTPCAAPVLNSATNPPTANPSCQGILSYVGDNRPRITMPTEQLSFVSTYFSKLSVDGIASYSEGRNTVNATQANWTGLSTRLALGGDNDLGNGSATRVLINGDLAAVYEITPKLRLIDDASYNAFRLPSDLGFITSNAFFARGQASLASPTVPFDSSTCPAPYTAATCPQHTSSAPADAATGSTGTYLGQNLGRETAQLSYTITPNWNVQLGYRYTYRAIYDSSSIYYAAETFDPGGAAGAAAAARGDCALPQGATFPGGLPAGCTLQSNGAVVFSGLAAGSDTSHNLETLIHGDSALANTWFRPTSTLTITLGAELYSGDHAFTRITPRQMQHYTGQLRFQPLDWLNLTGNVNDMEGNDNLAQDKFKEHDRDYGFTTTLSPRPSLMFDLAYNYEDIYNQAVVCYADSAQPGSTTTACPIAGSPVAIGALSTYSNKTNSINTDLQVQPVSALTLRFGMAANYAHGLPVFYNLSGLALGNFLNPLTPFGFLQFSYQQPYVDVSYAITSNIAYHITWFRYVMDTHGNQSPAGLAPLGTQNFDTDNLTFSVRLTK